MHLVNNILNPITQTLGTMAQSFQPSANAITSVMTSVVSQMADMDPSVKKIVTGGTLATVGAIGLARSNVVDGLKSMIYGTKNNADVKYGLAATSAAAVVVGTHQAMAGVAEIMQRFSPANPEPCVIKNPNNMCETTPAMCEGNLGIPRGEMPQIEKGKVMQYFDYFKNKGHSVDYKTVPATTLTSTQNQLDTLDVLRAVEAAKLGKFDPCNSEIIIAGLDNHVVDGHHRWAACYLLGGDIKVASINLPIQDILNGSRHAEGVTYGKLIK